MEVEEEGKTLAIVYIEANKAEDNDIKNYIEKIFFSKDSSFRRAFVESLSGLITKDTEKSIVDNIGEFLLETLMHPNSEVKMREKSFYFDALRGMSKHPEFSKTLKETINLISPLYSRTKEYSMRW